MDLSPHGISRSQVTFYTISCQWVSQSQQPKGHFHTIMGSLQPPSALDKLAQHHILQARTHTKRPETNVFRSDPMEQSVSGPSIQPAIVDLAVMRLVQRHLNRIHWHTKKPTTTVLHRNAAAITKSYAHSAFQLQKDGSLSHSCKFFKHITPTLSMTSTLLPLHQLFDEFPPKGNNFPSEGDLIAEAGSRPVRRRTAGMSGPYCPMPQCWHTH